MTLVVRPCTESECAVAAAIHVESLPDDTLALLGERFLGVLYRGILAESGGFIQLAERDGEVVGYVSGATPTGPVCRAAVRREWLRLSVAAATTLLKRPWLLRRALAVLWRRRAHNHTSAQAELLAIAVSAACRGQGVGQALVQSCDEEMRRRGVHSYHVMTTGGPGVQSFYVKTGFALVEEFQVAGARAHRFRRQVSAS
jgi:ribosomal protein S18 acetylase RimI-like enzyme